MDENLFIGIYWSARKETREQCAERISNFLRAIEGTPPFARWFLQAYSRKKASVPVGTSVQSIAAQLKTNNRDTDRKPIPELGFSLGAWNGDNDSPASLSITSGCYEERVRNAVLLSFQAPPPSDDAARGALRRLVEKSVAAWDPDHAVATSTEFLDRKGARIPWEIGWVTYQRGGTIEIHPY